VERGPDGRAVETRLEPRLLLPAPARPADLGLSSGA
jgi:hypothetical protein